MIALGYIFTLWSVQAICALLTMTTSNRPAAPETARVWIVDQAHARADDRLEGTADQPLQTINAAASRAMPGDTVLVRPGVYREHVVPARGGEPGKPIVYRAEPRGSVVVSGSDRFDGGWRPYDPAHSDVWVASLDNAMFEDGFNPFHHGFRGYTHPVRPFDPAEQVAGPAQRPNLRRELVRGMIWIDGEPLVQVISLDEVLSIPNSFFVPVEGGRVLAHVPADMNGRDIERRLVEVAKRRRVLAPAERGLGHIHLDGFVFQHAANNHPTPQLGMVSTRSGHDWVIENCTFRYAATIGLDIGSEWGIENTPEAGRIEIQQRYRGTGYKPGRHVVRNNTFADNGLGGALGIRTWGCSITGNIFERNNRLAFRTWEMGALKLHFFFDGLIEGNLFRDNDCFGIWLDNQHTGSRVTRNVVLNSYLAGINIELGHGPVLVDNNVVAFTRAGSGIYSHDAGGMTLAHNLVYGNAHFGIYLTTGTDRGEDSSNNRVLNNLVLNNKGGAISIAFPWDRAKNNWSDHNLIMGAGETMDEGTGVEPPVFLANTSHSMVKTSQIADALEQSLDAAGVPVDQRPVRSLFLRQPLLTFEQWQHLTGFDRNSRVFSLYHEMLGSRVVDFVFRPNTAPWSLNCPVVEGVDKDFLGRAMPSDDRLPGPFQDIRPFDTNRYVLWPLRKPGSPLPPRPARPQEHEQGSPDEKKDFSTPGF